MRSWLALTCLIVAGCGIGVGDEVVIRSENIVDQRGRIYDVASVSRDKAAFRDYRATRSTAERVEVLGRIFTVENGTRARVLRKENELIAVKVLSGEHKGQTGWVERKNVRAK